MALAMRGAMERRVRMSSGSRPDLHQRFVTVVQRALKRFDRAEAEHFEHLRRTPVKRWTYRESEASHAARKGWASQARETARPPPSRVLIPKKRLRIMKGAFRRLRGRRERGPRAVTDHR